MIHHVVTPEEDGLLLRELLRNTLRLSHRTLSALKRKEGGIRVDGEHKTVRTVVHTGNEICLDTDDTESSCLLPFP